MLDIVFAGRRTLHIVIRADVTQSPPWLYSTITTTNKRLLSKRRVREELAPKIENGSRRSCTLRCWWCEMKWLSGGDGSIWSFGNRFNQAKIISIILSDHIGSDFRDCFPLCACPVHCPFTNSSTTSIPMASFPIFKICYTQARAGSHKSFLRLRSEDVQANLVTM